MDFFIKFTLPESNIRTGFNIPIDVINKILIYVGELNNNMVITQYNPITNKEYYKITHCSDLFWNIKAVITTKRIYPYWSGPFEKKDRNLYCWAIPHYEKLLRNNVKF